MTRRYTEDKCSTIATLRLGVNIIRLIHPLKNRKKTELNASTKHLTGDIPNTTLKNTQIIHI